MSMHHTSIRWANVDLDRETELAAIKETIELVEKIKRALKSGVELQQSENLCTIDFDTFESEHMDFILATLGVGEARIVLRKDDVRMAETGISGVWRVQEKGAQRFEVSCLPLPLLNALKASCAPLVTPEAVPDGVFVAPAVLKELEHAQGNVKLDQISFDPPYMVELTRQPLSDIDKEYLTATLGVGDVAIELSGFANANIQSTQYQGIWRNTILNNAGKELLDSYVVTRIPPEVPSAPKEMADAIAQCDEIIEWLKEDMERDTRE